MPKKKKGSKKGKAPKSVVPVNAVLNTLNESKILELKERSKVYGQQNQQLKEYLMQQGLETQAEIMRLTDENRRKSRENDRLNKRLRELHDKVRTLQSEHRDEIKQTVYKARKENDAQTAEIKRANAKMSLELKELEQFQDKRFLLASELERTKGEVQLEKHRRKEQAREMESKFLLARERMRKDLEQRIALFKADCRSVVLKELDSESQRLRLVNKQMSDELRFHAKTNNSLRAQCEKLKARAKQLKLDSELARGKDRMQVGRAVKDKEMIRKLKMRNESLEEQVVTLKQELVGSRRELAARREALEKDEELVTLRQHVAYKTREVARIKRLARRVLDQRNDVERFFLHALEQVKAEIKAKRQREYKLKRRAYTQQVLALTRGSARNLPSMASVRSAPEPPSTKRVDLSDLGPEDRERVLRLLFSKINSAATEASEAARSATLPPHAFNIELQPGSGASSGGPTPRGKAGDNTFLTTDYDEGAAEIAGGGS